MTINVLATDDAQTLASAIAGEEISISNVTYNGAAVASGTFTDGLSEGIGIDEGIVLTTGNVNNTAGIGFFDDSNNFVGDADLNAALADLVPSTPVINEPASLEFDFETDGSDLSFNLVFATDEATSGENFFDDVFGLFLNGENIAFVPETSSPISVNTVGDTPGFLSGGSSSVGSSFTNVFTVELTDLEPGINTLEFAIADAGDSIVDSAIFIEGDVLVEVQPVNPVPDSLDDDFIGTDGNDGITGNDGDNTIGGRLGNDAIDGGAGNDTIDGGADTDTVIYQLDPAGVTVDLFAGSATDGFGNSDVLLGIENTVGSEFDDNLTGDDNNNSLAGRDGNDTINALGGNDFLVGAAGSDTLTGGGGSDSFIFISPTEGGDTITDFEVGADKITIASAAFGGGLSSGSLSSAQFTTGSSATDSNQRFIFDAGSGDLFFDIDGNGLQDQQLIANLAGAPELTSSDIQLL